MDGHETCDARASKRVLPISPLPFLHHLCILHIAHIKSRPTQNQVVTKEVSNVDDRI